jgi:thermolysin
VSIATVVAVGCNSSSSTPTGIEGRLQKDTGTTWVVDTDPRTNTPDLIAPDGDPAPVLVNGITPEEAALQFLTKYQDAFGTTNIRAELNTIETEVDDDGLTHVRFDQKTTGGLPVFAAGLGVHFTAQGAIAFVNGSFVPQLAQKAVTPGISDGQAKAAALAQIGGTTTASSATLGIESFSTPTPQLAYVVAVKGKDAAGKPVSADVYVDAQSSAVLLVDSHVQTDHATGKGVRSYPPLNENDVKSFEVTKNGAKWEMTWPASKSVSPTQASSAGAVVSTTDINSWDPLPAGMDGNGAAVDAYYHLNLADQFYRKQFHWKGYNNKNAKINILLHDNSNGANNAFWASGDLSLHFGDGNAVTGGQDLVPTDNDTCAHELTHAVTENTSKLRYQGESGALNESASDVFAALSEHLYRPDDTKNMWFSEDSEVMGVPFRDMLHPTNPKAANPQPDNVSNQATGAGDNGGVHSNSGIANNAFALMVVGGTNDTSHVTVEAGGWDLGQKVAWRTQRYGDRAATTFSQHARWEIAAAKKTGLAVDPVACAWVAVGVLKADDVKKKWHVTCASCDPDGGADGGCATAEAGGDASTQDQFNPDSCEGRADGVYCSQLVDYGAIQCINHSIAGGLPCPETTQKCIGPNGPGTMIMCQ